MKKVFDIIETKESILDDNDQYAAQVRDYLHQKGTFLVNLMACPGAGKTTLLSQTIKALKDTYRIGVMEADADGDIDARTISELGVKTIQIHTGGSCHMDAKMTLEGLQKLDCTGLDLVFLENVGNLVCPAEFDVGANIRAMMLSITEGDDKPLKYPLMFTVSDCLIINKIDAAAVFDFNMDRLRENVKPLNKTIEIIPLSALTNEGVNQWLSYLQGKMEEGRK